MGCLHPEAGYMTASVPKRVGPFESPLTAWAGPYMSLDSVYDIRTTRACWLYPSEARDTLYLRSALWSAPSVTVIRVWEPAVCVSKRRNSLTQRAPWPKVIRFPEPHPREGLDRPTLPAGMTDEAWLMKALL